MWKEKKVSLKENNTLATYLPDTLPWETEIQGFRTIINTKEW